MMPNLEKLLLSNNLLESLPTEITGASGPMGHGYRLLPYAHMTWSFFFVSNEQKKGKHIFCRYQHAGKFSPKKNESKRTAKLRKAVCLFPAIGEALVVAPSHNIYQYLVLFYFSFFLRFCRSFFLFSLLCLFTEGFDLFLIVIVIVTVMY